ncbi:hypothetical protein [Streptomyces sp. NBC_00690]|uniref:hypothetical protein n=1 Tax=Streptomyces sp. NBC_00690 TaxID=2975808 RepID=UPI002E2978BA|nr:hypothetical protein [Streptomyces sp. NBC_00690]
MDLSKKQPERSRWQLGPRWVELTVVFVATVVTGFVGGRVTDAGTSSSERAAEPAVTTTVTATQTVTASAEATPSPSPSGDISEPSAWPTSGGETSGASQPSQVYLADLSRVSDRGYVDTTPVTMLGTNYPKSIRLGCNTSSGDEAVYNVSGYKRLTATVGIPADTDNAIGSIGSIKVFNSAGNQIGKPVSIRSSATTELSVDIAGQDQVKITCALVKSGTPKRRSAVGGLGDAILSAS